MQERERWVSLPFPRVPRSDVDKFKNTWGKPDPREIAEMEKRFKAAEPHIDALLEEYPSNSDLVKPGAYYMYGLLEPVRAELKQVSEDTVETFRQEHYNPGSVDAPLNPMLDPYEYAEENPPLMVFVAGLPMDFKFGCMLVYELERRQFQADKLSGEL